MNEVVVAALLGAIGGFTRGGVGLLKALSLRRKIIWLYYGITLVISIVIGTFAGIVFSFDPRLSLLAGYAGTDILESVYKSFSIQKTYVVRTK